MRAIEKRHARTGAGGIADAGDGLQGAIGHKADHHGVFGIDKAAKGAGQPDPLDMIDIELVH